VSQGSTLDKMKVAEKIEMLKTIVVATATKMSRTLVRMSIRIRKTIIENTEQSQQSIRIRKTIIENTEQSQQSIRIREKITENTETEKSQQNIGIRTKIAEVIEQSQRNIRMKVTTKTMHMTKMLLKNLEVFQIRDMIGTRALMLADITKKINLIIAMNRSDRSIQNNRMLCLNGMK